MAEIKEGELIEGGAIPPDDFHDNIERIVEIADFELEIPPDLIQQLEQSSSHLLIDKDVLISAAMALINGNLVLQGPPGTGKSSFARALCKAFNCAIMPVTAHEDWSVFEVIGRQELKVDNDGNEEILPVNGFFTEAVIRSAGYIVKHFDNTDEPQAEWLLIDELNRAHLDRAFGELFTVLGTDEPVPITLPHQHIGNREIVTPKRFRIIATLNSVDRQFVNSLSQGLRRRFSFITIDVPPPRNNNEAWTNTGDSASLAAREFSLVIDRSINRIVRRMANGDDEKGNEILTRIRDVITPNSISTIQELFNLIEMIRYAKSDSKTPHLPIGTAILIDTVELFLTRALVEDNTDYSSLIDWAASIKIAPIFDADTINTADLEEFIKKIPAPFDKRTKKEIAQIVAAGLYFVE
jgi:MoxR-like ATPase